MSKPYVISPDEFGANEKYECLTLTYYADGVLTDDADDIIYNVEAVIGTEALNSFGVYENDDDSVYVRNEARKCDYEILRDPREYSDIYSG